MYKQIKDSVDGQVRVLQRLSDSAFIPMNESNTDYQQYLKFLEEGGQPLPADDNGQAAE